MRRSHQAEFDHIAPDFDEVELRYFDDTDSLVEEHRHNYLPYEVFLLPQSNVADFQSLEGRLARLETRLDQLAKKPAKKTKKTRKPKNTKK